MKFESNQWIIGLFTFLSWVSDDIINLKIYNQIPQKAILLKFFI